MLRRVSFYNHLAVTDKSILCDLFWRFDDEYFKVDNCLSNVFKPVSVANRRVYELFGQYVNS